MYLSIEGTKWITFCQKWYIKGRGWTSSGRSLPRRNFTASLEAAVTSPNIGNVFCRFLLTQRLPLGEIQRKGKSSVNYEKMH